MQRKFRIFPQRLQATNSRQNEQDVPGGTPEQYWNFLVPSNTLQMPLTPVWNPEVELFRKRFTRVWTEVIAVAKRALLKVAAPSAVVLTLLASGALADSVCSNPPERPSSAQLQDVDSLLRAFANAWRNHDYILARTAGEQLSDRVLRSRLEQLLSFGEARAALEQNDLKKAAGAVRKLEPGAKRALAATALARQQTVAALSQHWLQAALRDAAGLPESQQKELLLVMLPTILQIDTGLGLRLLDNAIHDHALLRAHARR